MVQQQPSRTGEPSNSAQPTVGGITVHLIGLFFGLVGVGVVYLVSTAGFTRRNAQHAVNWQILFTILLLTAVVLAFGLGELISDLFVFPAALLIIIVGFLDFVFCVWATIKAITGTEWRYPLTPQFI